MFELKLTLTESVVDLLKAELTRSLSEVKSSHRCEALGRGLGFRSYAATRSAAIETEAPTVVVRGEPFISYLMDHGFAVSALPWFHAAARVALSEVVARTPKLTIWGSGIGRPQRKTDGKFETAAEFNSRFVDAREELTSDSAIGPFLLSLALIGRVPPTKTVRQGTGSYWLKHIAENYRCAYPGGADLGPQYVPNGAFIAAAIHAGFRIKTYVDEYGYDDVNVNFNMSKPALVDLDCEIRPDGARAQDRRRRKEMREFRPLFKYNAMIG